MRTVGSVGSVMTPSRRQSRKSKCAKKSRLVQKGGDCNVYSWNVPKRDRAFFRLVFACSFLSATDFMNNRARNENVRIVSLLAVETLSILEGISSRFGWPGASSTSPSDS